jgi:SAM domain (Sterile alpha motif)
MLSIPAAPYGNWHQDCLSCPRLPYGAGVVEPAAPSSSLDMIGPPGRWSAPSITEPGETAVDVGSWLRNLGLERYETAFRENEVGVEDLCHLTAEDLEGIGGGFWSPLRGCGRTLSHHRRPGRPTITRPLHPHLWANAANSP